MIISVNAMQIKMFPIFKARYSLIKILEYYSKARKRFQYSSKKQLDIETY